MPLCSTFLLPTIPIANRTRDVCCLRALVAAAEQKHYLGPRDTVIHAVSRTRIDAQFPDTLAYELMIAEITEFDAIDPSINCDSSLRIAQATLPIKIHVLAVFSEAVTYLVNDSYSSINERLAREVSVSAKGSLIITPKAAIAGGLWRWLLASELLAVFVFGLFPLEQVAQGGAAGVAAAA